MKRGNLKWWTDIHAHTHMYANAWTTHIVQLCGGGQGYDANIACDLHYEITTQRMSHELVGAIIKMYYENTTLFNLIIYNIHTEFIRFQMQCSNPYTIITLWISQSIFLSNQIKTNPPTHFVRRVRCPNVTIQLKRANSITNEQTQNICPIAFLRVFPFTHNNSKALLGPNIAPTINTSRPTTLPGGIRFSAMQQHRTGNSTAFAYCRTDADICDQHFLSPPS